MHSGSPRRWVRRYQSRRLGRKSEVLPCWPLLLTRYSKPSRIVQAARWQLLEARPLVGAQGAFIVCSAAGWAKILYSCCRLSARRCSRATPTKRSSELTPREARYVLRGFGEDVKDEDVFASTTSTASVRMLLSHATDFRSEGHTVCTADVKTAFFNAHVKGGDVVYARPPLEWQPETLDPSKGTVIWKVQSLYVLRSAPGC